METIEEVLAKKARDDPKTMAKISDAIDLQGLTEHPGWETLKKHYEEHNKREGQILAARIMHGEPVPQREIDFIRGATAVAKAIFAYPETAVSSIERLAARLYAEGLDEAATSLEEESPYIGGNT